MTGNIYTSGEYISRNPTWHAEDSKWKAQQVLQMIGKHNLQVRRVCEVGCGAGEILRQMQLRLPADIEFYGYDISPQAVAASKQRENERLQFTCADLPSIETPPFDLALCLDVFEHVDDYMEFLRLLRQRATYKIFHIPLDLSVQSLLRCALVRYRINSGHLHHFVKETALLALTDTHHEIVDWFYTPASIDQAKTRMTKLAKVPRRVAFLFDHDLAVRVFGGYSMLVLTK